MIPLFPSENIVALNQVLVVQKNYYLISGAFAEVLVKASSSRQGANAVKSCVHSSVASFWTGL